MTDAYRDDLEAALARASDLEREVEVLRMRVAELETGDRATVEARENARRLEAALEREREELLLHHAQDVETEGRAQAARMIGTAFPPPPPRVDPAVWYRRGITTVSILAGLVTAFAGAKTNSSVLTACFLILICLGVIHLIVDDAVSGDRARRTR